MLLSSERVDWSGKYAFHEDGEIDFQRTTENGVGSINTLIRPMPSLNDENRAEFERTRAVLLDAMRPPTKLEFGDLITRLSFHCGMQAKDPGAVASMTKDYWNDFGHYPYSLIQNACAKYRRLPEGNNFMPNSGKFIELMSHEYHKLKRMLERAEKLLGISSQEEAGRIDLMNVLKRC